LFKLFLDAFPDKNKASRKEAKKMKYVKGCFEDWFRKDYSLIPEEKNGERFYRLTVGLIDCLVSIGQPDDVEMKIEDGKIVGIVDKVNGTPLYFFNNINVEVYIDNERMKSLATKELIDIVLESSIPQPPIQE